jgi:hypothetical protein
MLCSRRDSSALLTGESAARHRLPVIGKGGFRVSTQNLRASHWAHGAEANRACIFGVSRDS